MLFRSKPRGKRSVATTAPAPGIGGVSEYLSCCRPARKFAGSSCSAPMRARSAVWRCSRACDYCAKMAGTRSIEASRRWQRSFVSPAKKDKLILDFGFWIVGIGFHESFLTYFATRSLRPDPISSIQNLKSKMVLVKGLGDGFLSISRG